MLKVIDFYEKLNEIAPFAAASHWDNVGLLIGEQDRAVSKVLFTLDVTDKIVEYAATQRVDLIISHHPVIFAGLKNISQKKILNLIENRINVISAHTNLDVSKLGVNYVLAERLELQNIQTLSMSNEITQYQISVYTPEKYLEKIMSAMNEAGAGIIGNYSHCATYFQTSGQFKPLENSKPFLGQSWQLEKVNEIKLELVCEEIYLQKVLKAMYLAHPYETPAYTIIPLKQNSPNYGLGCFGDLAHKMNLYDFTRFVKAKLNAPFVKLWLANKSETSIISSIAVCGGSGNSIIHEAKQKADLYVSADFGYHQLLDAPMPVIDVGHFYSENPVIERLKTIFKDFDCEMQTISLYEHDINKLKIFV